LSTRTGATTQPGDLQIQLSPNGEGGVLVEPSCPERDLDQTQFDIACNPDMPGLKAVPLRPGETYEFNMSISPSDPFRGGVRVTLDGEGENITTEWFANIEGALAENRSYRVEEILSEPASESVPLFTGNRLDALLSVALQSHHTGQLLEVGSCLTEAQANEFLAEQPTTGTI
jgi:hypothetical protein